MEIREDKYHTLRDCDFWYDLAWGGYINPVELLKNPEDAKRVLEAVAIVREFEEAYNEALAILEDEDCEDDDSEAPDAKA